MRFHFCSFLFRKEKGAILLKQDLKNNTVHLINTTMNPHSYPPPRFGRFLEPPQNYSVRVLCVCVCIQLQGETDPV